MFGVFVVCALVVGWSALKLRQLWQQPLARISVEWPGASPVEIDQAIERPMRMALLGVPHVAEGTSVVTSERVEWYVTAEPGTNSQTLIKDIDSRFLNVVHQMPDNVTIKLAEVVNERPAVPYVAIHEIDCCKVELDRKQIARNGIGIAEVFAAMRSIDESSPAAERANSLARLRLQRPDGQSIRLVELAEIKVEREPSHIIHHW